jgi:hypothetical protein
MHLNNNEMTNGKIRLSDSKRRLLRLYSILNKWSY